MIGPSIGFYKVGGGDPWGDLGWTQYINLLYPDTAIQGTHGDVLLGFDVSNLDADFWNSVDLTGKDIRLVRVDDVATPLLYRLSDSWDYMANTGYLWVWSGSITDLADVPYRLYTGNSSATAPDPADPGGFEDKCQAEGFQALFDMQQDPSGVAPQLTDLTGNGYNFTMNNMESGDAVTQSNGLNAYAFDGVNERGSVSSPGWATDTEGYVGLWVDVQSLFASDGAAIWFGFGSDAAGSNPRFQLEKRRLNSGGYGDNNTHVSMYMVEKTTGTPRGEGVSAALTTGLHYIVMYNIGSVTGIWLDGVDQALTQWRPGAMNGKWYNDVDKSGTNVASLAVDYFNGSFFTNYSDDIIGPARIRSTTGGGDLFKTEYQNQNTNQWQQGSKVIL